MKKIYDIEISYELIPFYYFGICETYIGDIVTMYLILGDEK